MCKVLMALTATFSAMAAMIGLKAQAAGAPRSALTAPEPGPGGGGQPTPSRSPGPVATTPGDSGATHAVTTGSYMGSAVSTPYGTTQVQAVLRAGKLTDVVVLRHTDGARSGQIDSYALPILTSEALTKQSANIDVVSGATYTSTSYARSLQAALDKAGR